MNTSGTPPFPLCSRGFSCSRVLALIILAPLCTILIRLLCLLPISTVLIMATLYFLTEFLLTFWSEVAFLLPQPAYSLPSED